MRAGVNMKIKEAYWWALDQTAVKAVIEKDNGKELHYLATATDDMPLGIEIWNLLMQNKQNIQEPELFQSIRGEIDWPSTMVQFDDGRIESFDNVRRNMLHQLEQRLSGQFTPRILVNASRDVDANKEREATITAILSIEQDINECNQQSYNIEHRAEFEAIASELTMMHDINFTDCTGAVDIIVKIDESMSKVNTFTIPIPIYYFMNYGIDQMITNKLVQMS